MNRSSCIVGVCAAVLMTSVGLAGEPMEMPKPTAEHEVLGQWVGQSSSSAGYQIESGFWYGAIVAEARREVYLPLVLMNQE